MSGVTTTLTLTPPVQQSFDYKLLSIKVPNMIHNVAAMRKRMPANGGTVLRMSRFNKLSPALVPLGPSGQQPPPQMLTALNIDAKMSFYGKFNLKLKGAVVVSHA